MVRQLGAVGKRLGWRLRRGHDVGMARWVRDGYDMGREGGARAGYAQGRTVQDAMWTRTVYHSAVCVPYYVILPFLRSGIGRFEAARAPTGEVVARPPATSTAARAARRIADVAQVDAQRRPRGLYFR